MHQFYFQGFWGLISLDNPGTLGMEQEQNAGETLQSCAGTHLHSVPIYSRLRLWKTRIFISYPLESWNCSG